MKLNKKSTDAGYDYTKLYEKLLEIKSQIELEKERQEKEILIENLKDVIKGKEVILENAMSV